MSAGGEARGGGGWTLFEILLWSAATLLLYFLLMVTLPFFEEGSSLLRVFSEIEGLPLLSRPSGLVFPTAVVLAAVGTGLAAAAPALSPVRSALLWGATFAFLWADSVLAPLEREPLFSLWLVLLALTWLVLYFTALGRLELLEVRRFMPPTPRTKLAGVWLFGWAGFYLGLAFLLLRGPWAQDKGLALAWGSFLLSLLYFGTYLQLRRTEGREQHGLRTWGGRVYAAAGVVLAAWSSWKWGGLDFLKERVSSFNF